MRRVELEHGWQGGPASIEVEGDAMADDGAGGDVFGCVFTVRTPVDFEGEELEVLLGAGGVSITLPAGTSAVLRFSVAGREEQCRELVAAILEELGDPPLSRENEPT